MPPKQPAVQVYPTMQARRYLAAVVRGEIGGTLTVAIEAFADLIARATRANEGVFSRAEWNTIADALNGVAVVPGAPIAVPSDKVSDAHQLMGIGRKWFGVDDADGEIETLVGKLRHLDAVHTWAIVWAVADFWRHHDEIDHQQDEWWTLACRLARTE